MLAGVCGGLAEYLDLDVTILRLALAFIIFFYRYLSRPALLFHSGPHYPGQTLGSN